ncbi:nose resistant to fluoxetine protein 6 isoform X2 [Cephus cinctus]|uniref:Nose resistant to fluoxetine protein 6 isoform X2 n=1 Tax=Cephus cinctus TaxID=211228 RepID=A0AAJ7RRW0_CEPCN|nr:nose resistant to fluoxetine protein 6 isoform X2 [Cephus cinctus]
MAIKTKYYVVVSLLLFVKMSKAGNESNIQRLSKPRKESTKVTAPNFSPNESSAERNDTKDSRLPLIEFSKNNPELDWKNYLKLATVEEAKQPRHLDVDFMNEKLEPSGNSVKWLADLYDPLKWLKAPGKLVGDCRKDMDWFLGSLKEGELWSARNASGRYSSQFYFGNDFWLGSSTLCKELNGTNSDENFVTPENVPPYRVRFHVARMYLTLPRDVTPSTRQIFLGLCLPATCHRDDLMSMLRASADRVEKVGNTTHHGSGPKIHIASIKSVPANDYTPWTDPKVCILSAVGAAVLLLMIGATLYEHYRNDTEDPDLETSNVSNNNERISTYPDRNCSEERRISIVQDNGKELIEKINKTALAERQAEKREKGFWIRCLLAFSPTINGGKIISTDPAARDSLTCLHGLRVFSLGWVVMVHTYLQVFSIAENKTLRTVTERNFMFQTISNATFSVDTFFFISGLLVTILYYRSLGGLKTDKKNFLRTSAKKFFIMILYRFVRLTPAYLYVLGMNEIAMRQAQAKTVFSPAIMDHLTCEKFWWRNALYLNSLYPRTEMCMLWSWYMANDTQFYVLGIFLLLLSVKYLKLVVTTVGLIIISSWFTTFTVAYSNDYMARIQEPFALFDELYDKPWLRAGPYFIGTITGYLLFKSNCKLETPLYVKIFGWLSSATVMFSVVYGLYPGNLNVLVSSIYASLGHTAWSLAVAFIVIQCCTGSASLIDRFLSLRLMYPLSRLTYCAYLVHPVIMLITSTQMDGPLHLHNGLVLIVYFGNLVASYILSFCISIALEAPVVNLLKIAFISKKRSR